MNEKSSDATAVDGCATPYLASIGLLSSPTDADGVYQTGTTTALGKLQPGSFLVAQEKEQAERRIEVLEAERDEATMLSGKALAAMEDERTVLEHTHAAEMEAHRSSTALALRSMQEELVGLRELHNKELAAVRRQADEEHERLREWMTAQLQAVEANRDALLGSLAERREGEAKSSDSKMARMEREHKEQQQKLRALLAEESERLAAARQEVLNVSLQAGNERLALHTAIATAKRRAAAAAAESNESLAEARAASAEREAALRHELHVSQRRQQELAAESGRALSEVEKRGAEGSVGLRKQVSTLTAQLGVAQAGWAKERDRAEKAARSQAKLEAALQASESRAQRLQTRLDLLAGSKGRDRLTGPIGMQSEESSSTARPRLQSGGHSGRNLPVAGKVSRPETSAFHSGRAGIPSTGGSRGVTPFR